MTEIEQIIVASYDAVAILGMFSLVYVIRQTMTDIHINRTDPPILVMARKAAFGGAATFLLMTVRFQDYWLIHPSTVSVGIVMAGLIGISVVMLAINAVSLHLRAPDSGSRLKPSGFRHISPGRASAAVHPRPE